MSYDIGRLASHGAPYDGVDVKSIFTMACSSVLGYSY